ncbi:hypothetical protein [Legionella waltersii]|uniref:Uncharacterized protein n=1 Tax=Legionella waltersii TaxID=66969 RepID=A0A0W1AMZ9_9GAMM|nr:hypothetical protein [Legionella waltersii]KTD82626.1 hypothetical protein Lwal_0555 [Legionella waltersii]SNV07952.1 Uncharacterised protein [Legionella waltersii]
MTYDKSSEFTGTHTAFNLEMIRTLQGMDTMYPIFAAFNKWLRKINGSKDTLGDVREQNSQIFNTFVFLMNHNYLFYLIITNQFAQINELYTVHGLPLKNPKLLEQISREYQKAVQNQFVLDLHDNTPLDGAHLRNIDEGYFIINDTTPYQLYSDLTQQYQKINHRYQTEQVKAIREVYEGEVRQNITLIEQDEEVPEEARRDIINAHLRFEEELSRLEQELSDEDDEEDEYYEEDEFFSYDEDNQEAIIHLPSDNAPPLRKEITPVDEEEPDEAPLSIHMPIPDTEQAQIREIPRGLDRENLPDEVSLPPTDIPLREDSPESARAIQQSPNLDNERSFDSLPMSQKIRSFEQSKTTESIPKVESIRRSPRGQRVSNLMDLFENSVGKAYEKHAHHGSVRIHRDRHRQSVVKMQLGLEALTRKYLPTLQHLTQKQELALVDIKVDLENFINLLSSNLPSLKEPDKSQLSVSIKRLKQFEEHLLDAVEYEEVQVALKSFSTELESLSNLFTPPGVLASQQDQYEKLNRCLQQSLALKSSESVTQKTNTGEQAQTESETPAKPKVRRFAVGLARSRLIEEQRHQAKRNGFFSQAPKATPDQTHPLKIKKHPHEEPKTISEDVADDLQRKLGAIKTHLGFLTKTSETQKSTAYTIMERIENAAKKHHANPVDLSALATTYNSLAPNNEISPELVELSVLLYDQASRPAQQS